MSENEIALSVIVPAFNESLTIKANLESFLEYLNKQNYDYELIVVNDGSTDDTANICRSIVSSNKKLRLIDKKINQGKGAAIRDGFLSAKGSYLLFLDADNATSIDHLESAWPLLKQGRDLVIGSRNYHDAPGAVLVRPQAHHKRLLGKVGNKLIQLLAVPGIRDTQCGFKIMSRPAMQTIIPKTKSNRWALDIELLLLARHHGHQIGIIPVSWHCGPQSRVRPRDYILTFIELTKIRWRLISGKYK
jgi:dolichyl-phosphate beta-glucosyltransferase